MNLKILCATAAVFGIAITLVQGQTDSSHYFRALAWQTPISDLTFSQEPPPPDPAPGSAPDPAATNHPEQVIDIPTICRSVPYKFDSSKPIYFFRHTNSHRVIVATVDAHDEPILPLLFFQKDKTGGTFTVSVLPDNRDRFPGGNFRIFNFSHLAANVALSDKAFHLEPKEIRLVSPSFSKSLGSVHITIQLASGQRVYTNNLRCQDDLRYLLFLVDSPTNRNSVVFLRLVDSTANAVEPAPPLAAQ